MAETLTGSRGSGGRRPTCRVDRAGSRSATSSCRSSRFDTACKSARIPTAASWGWTPGSVLQRRNRRRCSTRLSVWPLKPWRGIPGRSRVGSTSTSLFLRAHPKNCRAVWSRRRRLAGRCPRNTSMSLTSTAGPVVLGSLAGQEAGQVSDDAQGLFDRVVRTRAGPRPVGRAHGNGPGGRRT